ncbi:phage tail protein [Acanthopleuribacter pedis]|uniref:Tail fiber protein n=1 Tax=Acanthopleuribacter pedis TaxID=442870 RepID=A0A8J7QEN1_9BACT|nr:tail fiber protein [Acanthopleuribacter pedis]MBO1322869.1 tail fiber protein [Acanthopleuribacter pedis]
MSEPYVGEIRCFPYTYAPRDWAYCDGQLLPINQNSILFAVISTIYGGNGFSNFAVPNLMGRTAMHSGTGPGLSPAVIGVSFGQNDVQLYANELPSHQHTISTELELSEVDTPAGNVPGLAQDENKTGSFTYIPGNVGASLTHGAAAYMRTAGQSLGHENRQPFNTLTYCIALDGIFPSRS